MGAQRRYVLPLAELDRDDVARVGGKNASLGEMLRGLSAAGIRVPEGFAVTAEAYRAFLDANDLDQGVRARLDELGEGGANLEKVGSAIRTAIEEGEWPAELAEEIAGAYSQLAEEVGRKDPDVAVRSSATAEDLPEASFAGQQETFLNIRGEGDLLDACRRCFASLFTDRAIAYRQEQGFDHLQVSLSVGVQRMVRSDRAGAGVMFSIDTDTGFPRTVLIDAAWGLGELLVAGSVDPDEYLVFKPLLGDEALRPILSRTLGRKEERMVYGSGDEEPTRTEPTGEEDRAAYVLDDDEVLQLARWAVAIEEHYGRPVDVEWAKDGSTGELFIVQARPETVHSRRQGAALKTYRLTGEGRRLVEGTAVGDAIGVGKACPLDSVDEAERFEEGAVLVTQMTDPDWLPIMKRAAAIVTEHGGRTSHAAIVSRELGLPAIVGAEGAMGALPDGQEVTVSCAEGDRGYVYDGALDYEVDDIDIDDLPATRTQVMLNIADPGVALRWWQLPAAGVGLARMEFIVDNHVKVHPMALARFDELEDEDARREIEELTRGYEDRTDYFVQRLAEGIARIAASRHPDRVILRMSDFKTNEYAELIGGRQFEPEEENPMLGWRGASRYTSDGYRDGFALECAAVRRVREEIGLTNLVVMIPFCRTVEEADRVLEEMATNGLVRGQGGLEVYVMAEIPTNVVLADEFAGRFDGFSIGSNDLTQLVLGIDRDSEALAEQFEENHPAVRRLIAQLIQTAHEHERKVGLCGQKPSDDPSFARFLVESGIDSISVTPDSFIGVKREVGAAERAAGGAERR
ncbi:MAG: phosphoenolpyruvate synthase [Actinomycetota bacterium]|nr:phosphoenolpyruvate synthase [Actinomycetota bacterium]